MLWVVWWWLVYRPIVSLVGENWALVNFAVLVRLIFNNRAQLTLRIGDDYGYFHNRTGELLSIHSLNYFKRCLVALEFGQQDSFPCQVKFDLLQTLDLCIDELLNC